MIHQAAADGFAVGTADYVAGGPEYPFEIEGRLRNDSGLGSGKAVLDLGAGTSKFSRSLLATGAKIVSVEPIPAMLEQLMHQLPRSKQGPARRKRYPCRTHPQTQLSVLNPFIGLLRLRRCARFIVF